MYSGAPAKIFSEQTHCYFIFFTAIFKRQKIVTRLSVHGKPVSLLGFPTLAPLCVWISSHNFFACLNKQVVLWIFTQFCRQGGVSPFTLWIVLTNWTQKLFWNKFTWRVLVYFRLWNKLIIKLIFFWFFSMGCFFIKGCMFIQFTNLKSILRKTVKIKYNCRQTVLISV